MNIEWDWIESHCAEDADCLVWQMYSSHCGRAVWKLRNDEGQRVTVQMARVVWELKKGPIKPGLLVVPACRNGMCLNPDHLECITKSERARRIWQDPGARARQTAAAIRANRPRGKLTIEQARVIRHSDVPVMRLAKEYGVHFSLIARIKRGESWKEVGNPFAGLMA